jgi:hypothetical protein
MAYEIPCPHCKAQLLLRLQKDGDKNQLVAEVLKEPPVDDDDETSIIDDLLKDDEDDAGDKA